MIYEVLYIVPSKFSDSEVSDVMKTVEGLFSKHEAKVLKADVLGKLKFAYPIKKFTHGTYVLTYIEAEGSKLVDIEQELKLSGEVLRHIVVKREDGIPETEFTITSYVAPITPEGKRVTQVEAPVPTKVVAPKAEAKKEESTEPTATSENVDEKLDDILDGDSVKAEATK